MSISAPTDIAGCKLWLDGTDAASITSSGGFVSQWNDKSGGGFNVTQGTGARQPTTTTLDSLGAVAFSGVQYLAAAGTTIALPVTIGVYAQFSTISGYQTFFGTSGKYAGLKDSGPAVLGDWSSGLDTGATNLSASVSYRLIYIVDSATSKIYLNGVADLTTGAHSGSVTEYNIGQAFSGGGGDKLLFGTIRELVVYDSYLSAPNVADLDIYLQRAGGGASVTLAGMGTSAAAGRGDLSLAADLRGFGSAASTGQGDLALAAFLAGQGSSASTGVADLLLAAYLDGHGDAASAGFGDLTVTGSSGSAISLAGFGASSSTGMGDLLLAAFLAGAGTASTTASGDLNLTLALSGHGDAASAGKATLTIAGTHVTATILRLGSRRAVAPRSHGIRGS